MSAKLLDIIDEHRARMSAYRDSIAENLAYVISDASKIADKPKLEHVSEDGPLVKQPRFGYDQVCGMLHEIQKSNRYIERLHQIEKVLLNEKSERNKIDYITIRNIEEFLGISSPKRKKINH